MLSTEYIVNRFLTSRRVKVNKIMQSSAPYAIRLAALNALDSNKGKWHGLR